MKQLILVIFLLMPLLAFGAGHVNNVKIKSVYCGYAGTYDMCSVEFESSVDILEKDPCHTLSAKRMQFKGDTAMGKAILSVALTAFTAQKSVDVYSTGSCTIYTGLSDVNFITIKN